MMDSVARTFELGWPLLGRTITSKATIRSTLRSSLQFTIFGGLSKPYSFEISSWARRGFAEFAALFFKHSARDPQEFGSCEQGADGLATFNMTSEQKLNAISQAIKDITSCLNSIVSVHKDSALGYAVWYCECFPDCESYESLVTLATCTCIAETRFIAPNVSRQVVKFEAAV